MALDVQRNWNISMAENLERTVRSSNHDRIRTTTPKHDTSMTTASSTRRSSTRPPIHLPDEIILQILDYVHHLPSSQPTLAACTLLSHQWSSMATPLLYASPNLYGHNYTPFTTTICPSINAHVRKSPLSALVKVLDLRNLVHQGSRSTTARLLGRTKGNLEEFCAPQASFAINCLPALSKCVRLRVLDLTLVSESPALAELLKTTAHLQELRTLRLPRSSGFGVQSKASAFPELIWPPKLEDLCLSGGIDAHFLHGVVAFPQTLRALTIEHCPNAKGFAVTHLLKHAVQPLEKLESLKVAHMPRLSSQALDDTLHILPQLKKLSISADYITPSLFDEGTNPPLTVHPATLSHTNLRTLELTYSGAPAGVEDKITAIDIMIAVEDGALPNLRQVRVDQALLWQIAGMREDVEALTECLQEGAKRDWERREWVFRDMKKTEYEQKDVWRRVSGVWVF